MQQRVTNFKSERKVWTPQELLDLWHQHLREKDRSAGTVTKYTQSVTFLPGTNRRSMHC
jgi:hypothetical protein